MTARPKRARARRAKAPPPGPSSFDLMLARAEMANVNARAVKQAQRGEGPVDYGVAVKQGFVCLGCGRRLARMAPLRALVHVNAEMPERCNACGAASEPGRVSGPGSAEGSS